MTFRDFAGAHLGSRVVSYDDRDVILYALAVGARATDLDLVFERDLRGRAPHASSWPRPVAWCFAPARPGSTASNEALDWIN